MTTRSVINSTTDIVEDVIELEAQAVWSPPTGFYLGPISGSIGNIGDSFDGTVFTPPTPDVIPVEERRATKNAQIDFRSREIIQEGFTFDSEIFSLSDNAQRYWLAIRAQVTAGVLLEGDFPFEVSTLADGAYDLAWVDFDNFIGTAFTSVETPIASGRALKQTVNVSDTPEDIVDNR